MMNYVKSIKNCQKIKKNLDSLAVYFFIFCWILIAFVGAVDTSLTVKLREGLYVHEKNPIARWILSFDGWEVARFIGLKMFGTIAVLGITICIFVQNKIKGLLVISGIASFQLFLLFYLLF